MGGRDLVSSRCSLGSGAAAWLLPPFFSIMGESTGIHKFSKAELASVSSGRSFQIAQLSDRCVH